MRLRIKKEPERTSPPCRQHAPRRRSCLFPQAFARLPRFWLEEGEKGQGRRIFYAAPHTPLKSFPHFPHSFPRKKPFFCTKRASYVENPSVVSRCISTFPHMAGLWIFRPFSRRKCGKLEEKHVVFQTNLLQNIFQCRCV